MTEWRVVSPEGSGMWDLGTLLMALARTDGDARVYASPTRRELLQIVAERPGIPLGELCGRLGVDYATALYHLRILEGEGQLDTRTIGRRRCVFPSEFAVVVDPEDVALLMEPTARRIALALVEEPGRSITDIIEALDVTPRVAYHHVKRLRDAGFLESASTHNHRGLRPTPRLYAALPQCL